MSKVDLAGNVALGIQAQRRAFIEKFGREPNDDDPIVFDPDADTPTQMSEEKLERIMMAALLKAEVAPHLIYAFYRTGRLLTQETYECAAEEVRNEWDSAMEEFEDA